MKLKENDSIENIEIISVHSNSLLYNRWWVGNDGISLKIGTNITDVNFGYL